MATATDADCSKDEQESTSDVSLIWSPNRNRARRKSAAVVVTGYNSNCCSCTTGVLVEKEWETLHCGRSASSIGVLRSQSSAVAQLFVLA